MADFKTSLTLSLAWISSQEFIVRWPMQGIVLFLCLLASCCYALSSWMRSFKTTPCKTDWFIKNQSTEGISSNLRHLLANWSIGAKEYFTLGSKRRTSYVGVFNFRSCKIHVSLKCQNASRILQHFKTYFFFFFFLLTEKYLW